MAEMYPESQRDLLERELFESLEHLKHFPADPTLNRRVGHLLFQLHRFGEALAYYQSLVSTEPNDPDAWYALGVAADRANSLETAERALNQAIDLGRGEGSVRMLLASVLQRLEKYTEAIEQARQALLLPIDQQLCGRLHSLIGACYGAMGDMEGALVHLQEAVLTDPYDAAAQHNLGLALEWREQFAAALPHFEKAATMAPNVGGNWYHLGRAARQAGAFERAREAYEKAHMLGCQDSDLHSELAWVLKCLDEPTAAIEQANLALQFSPEPNQRSWVHSILAACFNELGNTEAELQHRRQAAEASPGDADAQYWLGRTYYQQGKFDSALAHLKEATDLAPDDPDAWHALGLAASRGGDLEIAKEALGKAIAMGLNTVATQKELVWVLQSLNEWHASIEQASRTIEIADDPQSQVWLHRVLGACYTQLGKEEKAFAHLQQAVRVDPEDGAAQYDLGLKYKERNDLQASLFHLERATVLTPEDLEYRLALAQVCADVGKYEEAELVLRQLLNTNQHESAHANLVTCALDQGQIKEALRMAQEEVEMNPQSPVAWAALSLAFREDGDRSNARHALKQARQLDRHNAWVVTAMEADREGQT